MDDVAVLGEDCGYRRCFGNEGWENMREWKDQDCMRDRPSYGAAVVMSWKCLVMRMQPQFESELADSWFCFGSTEILRVLLKNL